MKKLVFGTLMFISLLVSAGKPVYTVILPANPGLTEKKAADEIRIHLQKLADVVIVTDRNGAKGKRIVIRAADPKMDVEEWSLKGADADEIVLSGGKRGIVYARSNCSNGWPESCGWMNTRPMDRKNFQSGKKDISAGANRHFPCVRSTRIFRVNRPEWILPAAAVRIIF